MSKEWRNSKARKVLDRYRQDQHLEHQIAKYAELQIKHNDTLLELEDVRMECARLRRELRQLKEMNNE